MASNQSLFAKLFKNPFTRMLTFGQNKAGAANTVVGIKEPAPTADPDEYGYYPDPVEHAYGIEKKILMGRLVGDDVFFCLK